MLFPFDLDSNESYARSVSDQVIEKYCLDNLGFENAFSEHTCLVLATKAFDVFLPAIDAWVRRGGVRLRSRVPLFRSYLFVHHAMDKASYLEVTKTKGLVRLLGERWDRLEVVPDGEVEAIQRVVRTRLPVLPYPYLRDGQRVRITRGPLADVEGVLVRSNQNKGLLVISVNLLRRSLAVQVDCTLVESA